METVTHPDFTVEIHRDEQQQIQWLTVFDAEGKVRCSVDYNALPPGLEGASRLISLYDFHKSRLPIAFSAVVVNGELVGLTPEQQDIVRLRLTLGCLSTYYRRPRGPSDVLSLFESDGTIGRKALFWTSSIRTVRTYLASIFGGQSSPKVIAMHAAIYKTTPDDLQFHYDHEDSR